MKPITVPRLRRLCLKGVISPIDFITFKRLKTVRKRIKHRTSRAFSLDKFSEEHCLLNFRFGKEEIRTLLQNLCIPRYVTISGLCRFTGLEGLCIMLRRLCYPSRLPDICGMFHRDPSAVSRIANYMTRRVYMAHCHRLQTLKQVWIKRRYARYSEVVGEQGSPLPNIVGFIDGTARPICRPVYRQKELYSGYKKQHVLKYQSVVFPDGMIGRLDGPFVGRRHDSAILHLSKILQEARTEFINRDGSWMSLYGDPGYSNQKFIKVGFKNHNRLSELQKRFNSEMSAMRVSVEYGFGKILQQFAFLDFKKNQKLYMQNLKEQYYVAALLVNCQTCMRGSQISDYFNCEPPTLVEYLQ